MTPGPAASAEVVAQPPSPPCGGARSLRLRKYTAKDEEAPTDLAREYYRYVSWVTVELLWHENTQEARKLEHQNNLLRK